MPAASMWWPPASMRLLPSAVSVSPAQNSMSETTIGGNPTGGAPLDGSQIRGNPSVSPPMSLLPQAKILPLVISAMCKGTMSQLTTGPQAPVVASVGRADTATGDDVTVAGPAANSRVWEPAPRRPRSRKAATPLASDVAVAAPSSVAPADVTVTSTPAAGFPFASFTWTTG